MWQSSWCSIEEVQLPLLMYCWKELYVSLCCFGSSAIGHDTRLQMEGPKVPWAREHPPRWKVNEWDREFPHCSDQDSMSGGKKKITCFFVDQWSVTMGGKMVSQEQALVSSPIDHLKKLHSRHALFVQTEITPSDNCLYSSTLKTDKARAAALSVCVGFCFSKQSLLQDNLEQQSQTE